jgi:Domain of unknown function (DUF5664)
MSSRKETEMTDKTKGFKNDNGKPRYDLIPVLALEELAKVLTIGAESHNESYDDENWRRVENSKRRFYSAAQRHIAEVRKGNSWDTGVNGTNCHHYACAISSLMFLLQKELEKEQVEMKNIGNKEGYEVKTNDSDLVSFTYNGGEYITYPESSTASSACDGCEFDGNPAGCSTMSQVVNCSDHKIIWIKKENK